MVQLDERLGAIAALVLDLVMEKESPLVADIGCDHGQLSAYLLERCERLSVLASDVSAPSLEKAKKLIAAKGLASRARFAVADGLGAVDVPVDVIVMAGMGADTILRILANGRDRIGDAFLVMQANVDLPVLRKALAENGCVILRELFCRAAGRRYVTICARVGESAVPDERYALLGSAASGAADPEQRDYFVWQRGVRVREMEQVARLRSDKAQARMEKNSRELAWISEAVNMNGCTVKDIEKLVGSIAPYDLAEEWDNVGLLFGREGSTVTRVLVAMDLTQGVLDEAKALGAELIVTHHPMMMAARRRITDSDREGRLMLDMAEAGVSHIAAHTNFDAAPGGVNDTLMKLMGAREIEGEGCVRAGKLDEGTTLGELARRAEKKLRGPVRVYGAADTVVTKLGCCSGAGSSELMAARALGADCFITGEVKHHHALDAVDCGMCILEAGHFETENPACEVMRNSLQNACDELKYNVTVFCSQGNPFGR